MKYKIIIAIILVVGIIYFFVNKGGPTITEVEARVIAEKSCIKGGEAIGPGIYNENSDTWWYNANLNANKDGCLPACIVTSATKSVELKWLCKDSAN